MCLAVSVAFPMSQGAPVQLGYAVLVVSVALAAGAWAFATRLRPAAGPDQTPSE
jgi:hypothetical protein